jgi:hypothetical protein
MLISNCWLAGNHLLLSNFGPYGIFMNVYVVITVTTVMLLRALWDNIYDCVCLLL